jgi:hypothetical protein
MGQANSGSINDYILEDKMDTLSQAKVYKAIQ